MIGKPKASAPRIGIVIASLESGGAERQALTLMYALYRKGIDVRLFCLDIDQEMPLPGTEEEREALASRIQVLGTQPVDRSTLSKMLSLPLMAIRLQRAVRRYHLDAVISFMERANIVNLLGNTRTARIISIRTHISESLTSKKGPLKRPLILLGYRTLTRRASRIVFNSQESTNDFAQQFPFSRQTLATIYNFPPLALEQQARTSPGTEAEQLFSAGPVVLTCGRLIHAKGHVALIRAFAAIANEVPDTRLVILGEGPQRQRLERLRAHYHLTDRIVLPGFQTNPYAWMRLCTLFVLPSRAEGFPNALMEAMLLGRPVIATDCLSGPRELLDPNRPLNDQTTALQYAPFGILTPPLDAIDRDDNAPLSSAEQALAEGMRALLRDEALRKKYAAKASERTRAFDHEAIADQWINAVTSSLS